MAVFFHFALPWNHPALFAALHHVVQEALGGLKDADALPPDSDLYRVVLDFDVRPSLL